MTGLHEPPPGLSDTELVIWLRATLATERAANAQLVESLTKRLAGALIGKDKLTALAYDQQTGTLWSELCRQAEAKLQGAPLKGD
jgi:hypothetical protein